MKGEKEFSDISYFPVTAFAKDSFILLEKGAKEEISAIFDENKSRAGKNLDVTIDITIMR